MKRKPTTAAEAAMDVSIRVVLLTLDNHVSAALESAFIKLRKQIPGLELAIHAAADWEARPERLEACRADIGQGDIIIATMMFMEPHIAGVIDALTARRDHCDAMICCMSAGEVMKLTRMGRSDVIIKAPAWKKYDGRQAQKRRCTAVVGVTPATKDFAIHTGYGSRLANLLPDSAVLVGRIRREFVANDSAGCAALCCRAQRSIAKTARA
jgi:hypothetical protein